LRQTLSSHRKRGIFFAQFGWLMTQPHPDVEKYERKIDMSDLEQDLLVMFQHKYFSILTFIVAFLLPTSIFMMWDISLFGAVCINFLSHAIM
jgi:fatty-acid desaturase